MFPGQNFPVSSGSAEPGSREAREDREKNLAAFEFASIRGSTPGLVERNLPSSFGGEQIGLGIRSRGEQRDAAEPGGFRQADFVQRAALALGLQFGGWNSGLG